MKTFTKAVVGLLGLAVAAGVAAHPGFGSGMGPGDGKYGACGQRGGMKDPGARLEGLKSELKLTDAQLPAWTAFENTVRAQFEAMKQVREQVQAEPPADASARMDTRIKMMEQRLEGMKTVQKAREELYATLTPEQKATADNYWQHRHGRKQ